MIRGSPSFIHHSTIPPSWLHKSHAASRRVRVVTGLPVEWGKYCRTVALGNILLTLARRKGRRPFFFCTPVGSLTFSSDGTLLTSGRHDKAMSPWDVQTGRVVKIFHGYTGSVRSVFRLQHDHISIPGPDDLFVGYLSRGVLSRYSAAQSR